MAFFGKSIGIDLGTTSILIAENGQIVLHEPTVVAIQISEQKVVAVGQEARDMYGRTPEEIIEVARPIQDGAIADYDVTRIMLRVFIQKVCGPIRFFKPRVMISVPHGVTNVESRAGLPSGDGCWSGCGLFDSKPVGSCDWCRPAGRYPRLVIWCFALVVGQPKLQLSLSMGLFPPTRCVWLA
jgi:hypothetical protein